MKEIEKLLRDNSLCIYFGMTNHFDKCLKPLQDDVNQLKTKMKKLEDKISAMEAGDGGSREQVPAAPGGPTTVHTAQCRLGLFPIRKEASRSLEFTTIINEFLLQKLNVPNEIVSTLRYSTVEYKPSRSDPDLYTVYLQFESISVVKTILSYTRNLPAECRVLIYVPDSETSKFRELEKTAYNLRKAPSPQKTCIKWFDNQIVLFVREGFNTKWRPYQPSVSREGSQTNLQQSGQVPGLVVPQPGTQTSHNFDNSQVFAIQPQPNQLGYQPNILHVQNTTPYQPIYQPTPIQYQLPVNTHHTPYPQQEHQNLELHSNHPMQSPPSQHSSPFNQIKQIFNNNQGQLPGQHQGN